MKTHNLEAKRPGNLRTSKQDMSKKAKCALLGVAVAIVLLAVAVWFFFFKGASYVCSLPADMQAVARLDAQALQERSHLSLTEPQQQELKQCGIDFAHPLYAFVDGHDSPGVLLPLRSARDFKAYLQGKDIEVQQQRGYHWAQAGQWLMVFSDDRCLVRGPLSEQEMGPMRGQMVSLMKQGGKSKGPLLQRVADSQVPASAAFSTALVQHLLTRFYPEIAAVLKEEPTGSVGVELGFADKKITADITLYDTGLENKKSFLVPLSGADLPQGDNDALGTVSMGVNGEALLSTLRSYPVIRTTLIALNFCVDLDMMIRSIQGGVTLTLPDADDVLPAATLAARLRDTAFMQNSSEWNQGLSSAFAVSVESLGDSSFCLHVPDRDICFGVKDNYLVASGGEPSLRKTFSRLQSASSSSAKDAQGCLLYAQLNIPNIQRQMAVLSLLMGDEEWLDDFLKQYDKLVLRVKAKDETATKE